MELNERDIKKIIVILLIALLTVLAFFLIKPVLSSIIGGLFLAYLFFPIHKRIAARIKNRNLSTLVTTLVVSLIVIVPLWLLVPLLINQAFNFLTISQNFDMHSIIIKIFPTAPDNLITQLSAIFSSFTSKMISSSLNALVDWLIKTPEIMLQFAILFFVFFFTLRDEDKLASFVSELSPLNENHKKMLVKKFKDVTDSIIYGQVLIGLVQGVIAGLGFIIFGVPQAFLLTLASIILSILPLIGPSLVWVPVAFYLLLTKDSLFVIGFLLYNVVITSLVDNLLRPYIVAHRTNLSPAVVLIGMIGGLFFFGMFGLVLGPLILAYLIILLKAYRDKTLGSLFQY